MQNKGKITKKQIKIIHALKNRLGWDDACYRTCLAIYSSNFATSCLELSEKDAEKIINIMKEIAIEKGVWEDYSQYKEKYKEFDGREGMASASQLRKIEALWTDIVKLKYGRKDEKTRTRMLRALLFRKFQISDLRFLEEWQAKKVIKMLETIKKEQEVKYEGKTKQQKREYRNV